VDIFGSKNCFAINTFNLLGEAVFVNLRAMFPGEHLLRHQTHQVTGACAGAGATCSILRYPSLDTLEDLANRGHALASWLVLNSNKYGTELNYWSYPEKPWKAPVASTQTVANLLSAISNFQPSPVKGSLPQQVGHDSGSSNSSSTSIRKDTDATPAASEDLDAAMVLMQLAAMSIGKTSAALVGGARRSRSPPLPAAKDDEPKQRLKKRRQDSPYPQQAMVDPEALMRRRRKALKAANDALMRNM
jgi:hypothetical protein